MSRIEGGKFLIEEESPQQCDFCGGIAELRPYGPNGETVCFPCAMKDRPAAVRRLEERVGNRSIILQ